MGTVLLVEDEIVVALDLADLIASEGWQVLGPAHSVATALPLLQAGRPDLAIVDIRLGLETAAPIVERLRALETPVVLATAYADPEAEAGPAFRGLPRFDKPITRAMLRAVLDRGRGIAYQIDVGRGVVYLFAHGPIRIEDVLDLQRRLRADPRFDPTFRMLGDYRSATHLQLDTRRLSEIAASVPFAPGVRRAFVVRGADNYGVGRMFQSYSEPFQGAVGVFYDFDAAWGWLDRRDG